MAARHIRQCALALLLILLSGSHQPLTPTQLSGRVVRVVDGDTIEVLLSRRPVRVRLYGVDCPERNQAFGSAARRFTSDQCFGKEVLLRTHGKDRHGRLLAEVILPGGRVLNHELLRAGLAWWFRQYAPGDSLLEGLENEARKARRGLWGDRRPVPPWEYRRRPSYR